MSSGIRRSSGLILFKGWIIGADGGEIRSSFRYRALGNAIALPCADYIMGGIYEVLAGQTGKEG